MNLNLTLTADSIFSYPDFEKIVSLGNVSFKKATFETLVCEDFEITKKIDFPTGSIEAFNKNSNLNDFILKATPCHFSLQKDHYRFERNLEKTIPINNLKILCDELNNVFASDQQNFFLENNKLFFRSDKDTNIATYSPSEINQIEGRQFLPHGDDAIKWHSLINEIQMFLYDLKLNKLRELENQLPINTIWFSGGGSFPNHINSHLSKPVITNSHLINQLSLITKSFKTIKFDMDTKYPFNNTDYIYYELGHDSKEGELLLGAVSDSFTQGKINRLNIRICIGQVCLFTQLSKLSKVKFWKKHISLDKIFNEYS